MKPQSSSPFPSDDLWPGHHNPRREALEAEMFLAHGAKPFHGFDPHDPQIRRELIDVLPRDFLPFRIAPPPELLARLDALPEGWEAQPEQHDAALALGLAIEQWAQLPPHLGVMLAGREALAARCR